LVTERKINLYLLTGTDEAQISCEAEKLIERLAGPNLDPFVCDIIQENDTGPTLEILRTLIRSILSPPFLGNQKIVWLKHFSCFAAEGDAKAKDPVAVALRELSTLIQQGLPEYVTLVLDGPNCDGRKAFFKACSHHGDVQTFAKPDMSRGSGQAEMTAVLQRAAQAKGIQLPQSVCEYLLEVLGGDTAAIDSELEKIICYAGGLQEPITLADVQQVCVGRGEEQTWAVAEALGQRNLQKSLAVADNLVSQSKTPEQTARSLIMSAAGFFRQSLRIRVLMQAKRLPTPNALKMYLESLPADKKSKDRREITGMHPYRAMKLAEQARLYNPHEMIQAIRILRDALWQTTSSSTASYVALENALLQIIGWPRR